MNAVSHGRPETHVIIFSDLDGTLLDRATYSFEQAEPALRLIREKEIPLVFCTSKTRSEVEFYRGLLGNSDPFIVENGGALFVPKGYFPFSFQYDHISEEYFVIELGAPYEELLKILDDLKRKTGILLRGFSDMSVEEIASLCGFSLEQAAMAKQREYDEPFLVLEPENAVHLEKAAVSQFTKGGRFYHIIVGSDKGKAVSILIELFKRVFPDVLSIGLGDQLNDLPLLSVVDRPILLQSEDEIDVQEIALPQLRCVETPGPEGWNQAVLEICKSLR